MEKTPRVLLLVLTALVLTVIPLQGRADNECVAECKADRDECIEACEDTLQNPAAQAKCRIICKQSENECLSECEDPAND